MKLRKVLVAIELFTDIKISCLKTADNWDLECGGGVYSIDQIQANVIKDDD